MMIKELKVVMLASILSLGITTTITAQIIKIGQSEKVYDWDDTCVTPSGTNLPLQQKTNFCVYNNPFLNGSDNNPNWNVVIDAPICPLRLPNSTFAFIMSQGYGLDKYIGTLNDPFTTREKGTYNVNIPQVSSRFVPNDDPIVDTWRGGASRDPDRFLAFDYTSFMDNLYKGTISGIANPDVQWQKFLFIVGIYKITQHDIDNIGNNIYGFAAGDLIGITHVELSATGQSSSFYNYRYALGISISKAIDGAKKWEYLGEIINQHVARADDIYLQAGNSLCSPGFKVHNISGGSFLVKNDSMYVYFDEFCDPINYSSPKKDNIVPRVAVASAKISEILTTAGTDVSRIWHKYRNGSWNEDAITGMGDNVVPLPVNLRVYRQGSSSSPGSPADCNAWFCTHNSATTCRAFGKDLYLMTLSVTTESPLRNAIVLYRSTDGIQWRSAGELYVPFGTYSQYSCFISATTDASDDFHVVGKEFYVMYPNFLGDYRIADIYRSKIQVLPDMTAINSLLLD